MTKFLYLFSAFVLISSSVFGAAGELDSTFNGTGKVVTEIANSAVAYDLAVQRDGKIVAVGRSVDVAAGTNFDFTAVRYNEDGSLDTSFANNGKFVLALSQFDDTAFKVKILQNGKILLAGYSITPDLTSSKLTIIRLNSNGLLDTTFGNNGIAKVNADSPGSFPSINSFLELEVNSDGKIIVGGTVRQGNDLVKVGVFRFNRNGSVDTTFGNNGEAFITSQFSSVFQDLVIMPNSKIVVLTNSSTDGDIITRLTNNGQPDTNFGNGSGSIPVGINQTTRLFDLALQNDGKLLIAGTINSDTVNSDLVVFRYRRNLVLDTTFGTDGKSQISVFPRDGQADIEVQKNGKILLLGSGLNPFNNTNDFSLSRLTSNGVTDFSFNQNGSSPGLVITDFFVNSVFSSDNPNALTIHRGKVIAAGDVFPSVGRRSFGLARYSLRKNNWGEDEEGDCESQDDGFR